MFAHIRNFKIYHPAREVSNVGLGQLRNQPLPPGKVFGL
jgi:hypothetical protein